MGKVALLSPESEVDMTITSVNVLGGDLKNRLAERKGIHAQKIPQSLCAGGAMSIYGRLAVPAEGGLYFGGHGHMVG